MNLLCDESQVMFEAKQPDGGVSSNALWRLQPLSVEWGGRFASSEQVRGDSGEEGMRYQDFPRLLVSNLDFVAPNVKPSTPIKLHNQWCELCGGCSRSQ